MSRRGLIDKPIGYAAIFVLLAWFNAATASNLGVTPIRVYLSESAPTAALTLENNGSTPTVVQLQLMRWDTDGVDEQYRPTYEVVATPPIATLQPGRTQIVRVGLSRDVEPERELAYRLYIEEVPPLARLGQQGLQVALRIGVPVFVAPKAAAQPQLQWRAVRDGADSVALRATNVGNAHLRLMSLGLRAGEQGRVLAERQIVGYLLPGQSRQWVVPVKGGVPEGGVHLSVVTEPRVADVRLELETP